MRAGLAAALIAVHAVQRSNLCGFPAGGCPPAAGGQERPAAMRPESWRGRRPDDSPPHGPARAPRASAVPPRGPRGKRNQTVHTPLAPRRAVPKYAAARASRPPRGRQEKQKTKKTAATRNYGRAVRRPCAGLPRGRAAGGLKCRRRPLGRRGLFPSLVGSLCCRALPGPSSCRTNHSVPVGIAAWIFALAPDALDFLVRGHAWATRRGPYAACHCRARRIGAQPGPWNDSPGAPGVGLPPPPPAPAPAPGQARRDIPGSGRAPPPLDDSGRAALRRPLPHLRPAAAPGRPAGRAQRS